MKKALLALLLVCMMTVTGCTTGAEGNENETEAEKKWVFEEGPAVSSVASEEEILEKRQTILDKGTLLYEGETDTSYTPSNSDWLAKADDNGALALLYTCEDATHKSYGIMRWNASVNGKTVEGTDILADEFVPDDIYLEIVTMEDLKTMFGVSSISEIKNVGLGAWSGGKIIGLYYLSGNVAEELIAYEEEVYQSKEIIHTYDGDLSNENATQSAKNVYAYMQEMQGKACITGQMESTWMGTPNYEMIYVRENTGKEPAIRGLDFMGSDFEGVVERAIEWWEEGGIVTICWHTGADFNSSFDQAMADEINWEEAFTKGTTTYNKLVKGMDRAVPYLQELEDAGVAVLWRPFHEFDGGWFWWGKGGSDNFVKLWQMMYSRYTEYWGLDNLIWVLGYSPQTDVDKREWYPGDDYVDLLGCDCYEPGASKELYELSKAVAPEGMPIVYHECGNIPTEAQMTEADALWGYFMTWHTDNITDTEVNSVEHLKDIYNSEYFITRDELPDFKGSK